MITAAMTEITQPSVKDLVYEVLSSDLFKKASNYGVDGYLDKQHNIFIPKSTVSYLVREITDKPSILFESGDLDEYLMLCQARIVRTLKKNIKLDKKNSYRQTFLQYLSKEFLKHYTNQELNLVALYIDLVGSTLMSMRLSGEKLSTLVGIFTQEMSSLVSIRQGYVLKYVGDAVIAFFPQTTTTSQMCHDAFFCALDMIRFLNRAVNDILIEEGFEPLSVRVGLEMGNNKIIQLGNNIDILGYTMNIAAKITSISKPNGICVGQMCYSLLDDSIKQKLKELEIDEKIWKYKDQEGNPYKAYELAEDISSFDLIEK